MKNTAALTAIALLSTAPYAIAQCDTGKTLAVKELSQEETTLRTAIYLEMCKRVGGDLVDGDDSELGARVKFPTGFRVDVRPSDELMDSMRREKRRVILASITEATGKVSWVYVLKSSGNQRYDAAAMTMFGATTFDEPTTLDGIPIKVFRTLWYSFETTEQ